MEREIIRHSEGYWSLVDERGQLICKFRIGDDVKAEIKLDKGEMKTIVGDVAVIEFGYWGTDIGIHHPEMAGIEPAFINDIVSMERL